MSKALLELKKNIRQLASPAKAAGARRFFKTGKGQYGEGDIFLGLTVPESRSIVKKYLDLSLADVTKLLTSKIHEERLIALALLVAAFKKDKSKKIVDLYLAHTKFINNWDLVDSSADKIVGEYLLDKSPAILFKLVRSKSLWERRISIIATFQFIKNRQFKTTLDIATLLLADEHDLIHKAVGWMLREVGKRDQKTLENFLKKNGTKMPRTALRYAIERFPEAQRQAYLSLKKSS